MMKTGKEEQSQKSKEKGGRGWQWEEVERGMGKNDKEGGVWMENSVGVWFMPGELCVSRWGFLLIL